MGSTIEVNDTLQITTEQGFPAALLDLKGHKEKPLSLDDFVDSLFTFHKPGARLFHVAPTRCFLVHNIAGKWLYWGHVLLLEQTIRVQRDGTATTSGKYKLIKIYDPVYQEQITRHESPKGLSYFE